MSALAAAAIAGMAGIAIVTQDQTALRAAARESAPQQAVLWQGEVLEVRGQRIDHLQVWDHRRERAGFVRASQVRQLRLHEVDAPQLLAVMRFLRDTPGAEALGIAYVAAYLKAAPAAGIDAEVFDTLGTLAERLARRAASARPGSTVGEHLDVARQYGVQFQSFDHDGTLTLCYDGEAFRRVLSMPAADEAKARAALALTRHECIDPLLQPLARHALDQARADLLDGLGGARFAQLSAPTQNRLRLRRAGVWATLAFERSRRGEAAQAAAQRAIDELAAVQRSDLSDEDLHDEQEAAVRVGASRWAALPVPAALTSKLSLRIEAGEPGQTCVVVGEPKPAAARRCTWGSVWLASARVRADGRAAVLAVQPLAGWTELWVLRAQEGGWTIDVLPPAAGAPGLGSVEFAGWVPGAAQLLVAREARIDGKARRSFEVLSLETLNVHKQASTPQLLASFAKGQDAQWRQLSLILR